MRAIVALSCVLFLVACGEDTQEPMDAGGMNNGSNNGAGDGGTPDGGDQGNPVVCPTVEVPDGPEPDFPGGDPLLSIDVIYPEYERGAKMIMLDARPPFDYNIERITGAINIPYYDVEACVDSLPRDTWIVAYCACPHQESLHATGVLAEAGFTKLHVLDEGYFEWKARDYPIEEGPLASP